MIIFQKITCFLLLSLLSITPYSAQATDFSYENEILEQYIENSAYKVYQNNKFLDEFNDFNTALEYAELWENATLVYEGILWHNFENMEMVNFSEKKGNTSLKLAPLKIYQNKKLLAYEDSFNEACKYAERWENSFVYGGIVLWDNYAAYYYIKNEEKVPCYDIGDYVGIRKNISISSLY